MEWEVQQNKDKDRAVRENMRVVQVAAEHFAADHAGVDYPTAVDDRFKSYLPGGQEGKTASLVGPINPFNGQNEFPVPGHVTDISAVRHGTRFAIAPGEIWYSPLAKGKGYAIVGGAHDGKALIDVYRPTNVLVLTNITAD